MSEYKLRVVLMDEALTFVRSLPLKVQQKITYNFKKTELGVMDKELFKKLEWHQATRRKPKYVPYEKMTVYQKAEYRKMKEIERLLGKKN